MEDFGRGYVNATSKNFTFSACIDESADQQVLILSPCSLAPLLPCSLATACPLNPFNRHSPMGLHTAFPLFPILASLSCCWLVRSVLHLLVHLSLVPLSRQACRLPVLIVATQKFFDECGVKSLISKTLEG